jgi:hypothetical protein
MKQLRPFTRLHRIEQRFINWLDALTAACMNSDLFILAVIVFSLAGTWVFWKGW